MKINVFGFGKGDFTDQKTGVIVEGKKLYYAYKDSNRKDLVGMATGYIFLTAENVQKFDLHELVRSQICEVQFNQFGKLISIVPCLDEAMINENVFPKAS